MNHLLIFDIDGTLSDTVNIDDTIALSTFRLLFNLNIGVDEWEKSKNITSGTDLGTFNYFYPKIITRVSYKNCLKLFKEKFLSLLTNEFETKKEIIKEINGAKNFVEILQNEINFDIAIATGSFFESGLLKTNSVGINISELVYSNSDYFSSRSEIVNFAIKQSNEKSGKIYRKITYFGDGLWDYNTSKELGINFIKIGNNPNFINNSDIISYPDYEDYSNIIQQLNKF